MAATAKKQTGYYNQAHMGNLAYDQSWQDHERALERAGRRSTISFEHTKTQEKKQVKAVAQEVARVAQAFPVVAMTGFVAVAAVAVMMLVSYVQLTDLSSEVVTLRNELATLETEHITLTTAYEQMFDLASVKEAAVAGGMTSPSPSQIYYIDLSGGDSAVVYEAPEKVSTIERLYGLVTDRVETMVEYFR